MVKLQDCRGRLCHIVEAVTEPHGPSGHAAAAGVSMLSNREGLQRAGSGMHCSGHFQCSSSLSPEIRFAVTRSCQYLLLQEIGSSS